MLTKIVFSLTVITLRSIVIEGKTLCVVPTEFRHWRDFQSMKLSFISCFKHTLKWNWNAKKTFYGFIFRMLYTDMLKFVLVLEMILYWTLHLLYFARLHCNALDISYIFHNSFLPRRFNLILYTSCHIFLVLDPRVIFYIRVLIAADFVSLALLNS